MNISLHPITEADLDIFFEFENDPIANKMADFVPRKRKAFNLHWQQKILANEKATAQGIWIDDVLVGNVLSWINTDAAAKSDPQMRLVGYWIGREHWGKGIATKAVEMFLKQFISSPVFAYIDKQNEGSVAVAYANGFFDVTAQYPQLISKDNLRLFRRGNV
ncbi:GNAT family N-acetyltransferase [Shewanella sp. SG41-4]|uniref:GNAT family N-acetyltransferase n=1 Tax=Shewanella sp. SG41-4 TaxID=2760976 RepID=UPI00160445F0|nr:GNAT family N-acetyltransferase [Shewanella sp. SG41-4]MBB1438483.1 GNAT family N-acetyltransferase [Shewanella sp. SG41-4]